MDRQQAAMQIKGALDTVLKRDLDELTDETRLFEDLNLDSTSVIELLITIEEAIGLTVDVDELDPEVFTTVGSLTDFVAAMAMAVCWRRRLRGGRGCASCPRPAEVRHPGPTGTPPPAPPTASRAGCACSTSSRGRSPRPQHSTGGQSGCPRLASARSTSGYRARPAATRGAPDGRSRERLRRTGSAGH